MAYLYCRIARAKRHKIPIKIRFHRGAISIALFGLQGYKFDDFFEKQNPHEILPGTWFFVASFEKVIIVWDTWNQKCN